MNPDTVVNLSLVSSGMGRKKGKKKNNPMEEFYLLLVYASLEKWMVGAERIGERFKILPRTLCAINDLFTYSLSVSPHFGQPLDLRQTGPGHSDRFLGRMSYSSVSRLD